MDDAIHDGVDILSLSLGPDPPQAIYFEDAVSIASFHAFRNGILVSASAGNSAFPKTASNVAPWILTVAASTIDRDFNTYIHLGNSKIVKVIISANILCHTLHFWRNQRVTKMGFLFSGFLIKPS